MKTDFLSVGIDIGTTTTQVIFSRITIEKSGGIVSASDFKITGKEVIYLGKVNFTPLINRNTIDIKKLTSVIDGEYRASGINAEDVFTGAVIITGETARKDNAREVLESLAGKAGNFVVSTAGPDLEAVLAGWGSGAGELSREIKGYVANFDIGGGTTNVSVFSNGEVIDSYALDIGGRLIQIDRNGCVNYVSDRLRPVLEYTGIDLKPGDKADFDKMKMIALRLSQILLEITSAKYEEGDTRQLFIGHQGKEMSYDAVLFSGGVSEFIYNGDKVDTLDKMLVFDDMGPLLGSSIREMADENLVLCLEPKERIRATVIGAGAHSVGISGGTVCFPEGLPPLRNIPVVRLFEKNEEEELKCIAERIIQKSRYYENDTIAVAFKGPKNIDYYSLKDIADQIMKGFCSRVGPIIIIIENDFAKALGQIIKNAKNDSRDVICLDRIKAESGDYIDIGTPLAGVVPVVIKTLIFNS